MRLIDDISTRTNIIRHKHIAKDKNNLKTITAMACHEPVSFLAGIDYGMELAFKVVANEPTAYDPDKVVQRLEQEKTEDVTTITYEHDIFIDGYREGLSKAIEIVKSGGSE